MKFIRNNDKKIFFANALLSLFFIAIPAHANILTDVTSGMTDLISIISQNPIVAQMRISFCDDYSHNNWPAGDIRFGLGQSLCTGSAQATLVVPTTPAPLLSNIISTLSKIPTPAPVTAKTQTKTQAQQVDSFVADDVPETVISTSTSGTGDTLNNGQILYWTNIERNNNGSLAQLSDNSTLDTMAGLRIDDMFAKQYFDHISPTGDNVSKMAAREGYSFITIGENIALGNFGSSRDLVEAWMASPGHRANILNTSYTQIGIAAKQGIYNGQEVWIASQVFGKPLADCPSPSASTKATIDSDQISATNLMASLTQMKAQLAAIGTNDTTDYNKVLVQYNSTVSTYNTLVAQLKQLAAGYNTQVQAFNTCIQTK